MATHGTEKNWLVCFNCNTQFNEDDRIPIVLSCLHTLCHVCLKDLLQDNTLTCPKCQYRHDTSDGSADSFCIDYTRKDLLKFFSLRQDNNVVCGMCENESALNWCRDCENCLCGTCRTQHAKNKKWKGHEVFDLSQITDPSDVSHEVLCTKDGHRNKPLEVYCIGDQCKMPVCSTCWMVDHSNSVNHTPRDIKDQFEEDKEIFQKEGQKIKEKIKKISKFQEDIDQNASDISKKTIKAEFEITSFFNRCIRLLEKQKKSLIKDLDNVCREKHTTLSNQRSELETVKENMKDAVTFLAQSERSKNPAAFLNLVPTMQRRLRDLIAQKYDERPRADSEILFKNINKGSEFQNVRGPEFADIIRNQGLISTSSCNLAGSNFQRVNKPEHEEKKNDRLNMDGCNKEIPSSTTDANQLSAKRKSRSSREQEEQFEEKDLLGDEEVLTTDDEWSLYVNTFSEDEFENGSIETLSSLKSDRVQSSIMVTGFNDEITEDHIKSYFNDQIRSKGEEVTMIQMNRDEGWSIVSFPTSEVAKDLCVEKHKINDCSLTVKNMGSTVAFCKIRIADENKLAFIQTSTVVKGALNDCLKRLGAEIDWSSATEDGNSFILTCTFTSETEDLKPRLGVLEKIVASEVFEFFETLNVKEYKIDPVDWDFVEQEVNAIVLSYNTRCMIRTENLKSRVLVVGFTKPFSDIVEQVSRLTDKITVEVKLENYKIELMKSSDHFQNIKEKYRGVSMKISDCTVTYSGVAASVMSVQNEVSNNLMKVISFNFTEFSIEKIKYLKTKSVEVEIKKYFRKEKIPVAWTIQNDNTIVVYATSNTIVDKALDTLSRVVVDVTMQLDTGSNIAELKRELQEVEAKTNGLIHFIISPDNKLTVFTTFREKAEAMREHITIIQNYPVEKIRCIAHFNGKAGQTFTLMVGDITELTIDVLICSSDKVLQLGAGVGLSLTKKGGEKIQKECKKYLESKSMKALDEGEVFFSSAGELKLIKMVAHLPGKKWQSGLETNVDEKKRFIGMVQLALGETQRRNYEIVAMPALCCGNNEYPVKVATEWTAEAINLYLNKNGDSTSVKKIYFCDVNETAVMNFAQALGKFFPLMYSRK